MYRHEIEELQTTATNWVYLGSLISLVSLVNLVSLVS